VLAQGCGQSAGLLECRSDFRVESSGVPALRLVSSPVIIIIISKDEVRIKSMKITYKII
jgi:hypothetical protein